jgi:hypothetical protein
MYALVQQLTAAHGNGSVEPPSPGGGLPNAPTVDPRVWSQLQQAMTWSQAGLHRGSSGAVTTLPLAHSAAVPTAFPERAQFPEQQQTAPTDSSTQPPRTPSLLVQPAGFGSGVPPEAMGGEAPDAPGASDYSRGYEDAMRRASWAQSVTAASMMPVRATAHQSGKQEAVLSSSTTAGSLSLPHGADYGGAGPAGPPRAIPKPYMTAASPAGRAEGVPFPAGQLIRADDVWQPWVLELGAKDRNDVIRSYGFFRSFRRSRKLIHIKLLT